MALDPAACREHLAELVDEEVRALRRLEELLAREHELLVANDVVALEAAADARQACVGELLRTEDERRLLCRMHGHAADTAGLERLLAWCDPSGTLRAGWSERGTLAARCRELNDRNGALVTARLKRVEGLLSAITGKAEQPVTYGPRAGSVVSSPGRVLDTRA